MLCRRNVRVLRALHPNSVLQQSSHSVLCNRQFVSAGRCRGKPVTCSEASWMIRTMACDYRVIHADRQFLDFLEPVLRHQCKATPLHHFQGQIVIPAKILFGLPQSRAQQFIAGIKALLLTNCLAQRRSK